jgi:hypothetical protein
MSGIFGDPRARVMGLIRRGKKRFVGLVAAFIIPFTTGKSVGFATCPVGRCEFIWMWRFAESLVEGAEK